jgi:hypothetical protein
VAMGEGHDGLCEMHQSDPKMKWTLRIAGYFWPTMTDDCNRYRTGCEACQRFGDLETALTSIMHPIIRHWEFRGWG